MNTHPIHKVNQISKSDIFIINGSGFEYMVIRKDHFNSIKIRLPDCSFLLNELVYDLGEKLNENY